MKISGIKGIVWDLDGTLLDSYTIFEQILQDLVAESGFVMPSRQVILRNFHGSLEDCIKNIFDIKSAAELKPIVDKFLKMQEHHYTDDLETLLYEDALLLAQRAAKNNIKQILVTNRSHKNRGPASPKHIIAATTLVDCIHEVRPGDEVEYRKPDKRSLGDWLERHKFLPSEVIVIGDQFVDAQLAINIGAKSLMIKRNGDIPHLHNLTSKDNLVVVDSLEDIELSN